MSDEWDDASSSEMLAQMRRLQMRLVTAEYERQCRGEPSARFNRILVDSEDTARELREAAGDKLDGVPVDVSPYLPPGSVVFERDAEIGRFVLEVEVK